MQAYGGPENLQLAEVPEPKVGPGAVLVRVKAAGVNPVDRKIGRGYVGGHPVWVRPDSADLTALAELADQGRLTVHVDREFPLAEAAEAAEAWRVSAEGRTRGKIVLTMS
ncbi:zinc-binding dehydrogenase [Streptantibioticus ferralitis]|uniref:Zinc-binding dehydrogenase n=1 Tax=Streptantibioticus ferralitis TaxID=236510 RepID=A0ABT5Z2Y5_9ACTN|nr:zinc-binding dehydrogenase [Streptantibioticus ferralitis]MDF2258199.1 zinc-binding dehydrogenase [Streptantibioticus ferralitis]